MDTYMFPQHAINYKICGLFFCENEYRGVGTFS